jgi:hypothetical protein
MKTVTPTEILVPLSPVSCCLYWAFSWLYERYTVVHKTHAVNHKPFYAICILYTKFFLYEISETFILDHRSHAVANAKTVSCIGNINIRRHSFCYVSVSVSGYYKCKNSLMFLAFPPQFCSLSVGFKIEPVTLAEFHISTSICFSSILSFRWHCRGLLCSN